MARIGLYESSFEKDACGVGLIADSRGRVTSQIVQDALLLLRNLAHRGAQGADGRTGDGAGILVQIPREFFLALPELQEALCDRQWAVGQLFVPTGAGEQQRCEQRFAELASDLGFSLLAWRTVPVQSDVLGAQAKALEPIIRQVFLSYVGLSDEQCEAKLLRLRRRAEKELRASAGVRDPQTGAVVSQFYVASLSCRTLVYKTLALPESVGEYFPDLRDPRFTSAIAMVHSRFSTNTLPAWELAHPFRYICHNGEINTIRGNLNWMSAREESLTRSAELPIDELRPLIPDGQSDSAALDQAVELFVRAGRPLPEAMMVLMPEAWESQSSMDEHVRAFYEFHAARMEPWDGPAAVCFTDGRIAGAALDRNGLRPCRYHILDDGLFVLSSETGVLPYPAERIKERGRLGPGRMIVIDTVRGLISADGEIKKEIAKAHPYRDWVLRETAMIPVHSAASSAVVNTVPLRNGEKAELRTRLLRFGFTDEEVKVVMRPMFSDGDEAVSSMGNDTPLAILSEQPQLLFKYFKQLFAQVTNPPIDPIRERLVMSLAVDLGPRPDPLRAVSDGRRRWRLEQPILDRHAMALLADGGHPILQVRQLSTLFALPTIKETGKNSETKEGVANFVRRLNELCASAIEAAKAGVEVMVLSDRAADSALAPLPSLLAVSAVHQALIRAGVRSAVSIVADTGEARDVHHFACLIGYGADAVHPYLALELGEALEKTPEAEAKYIKAIGKGLLKIMSKMGISTLRSYCGAQIFEILGISQGVVDEHFGGTPTRIGGLDLAGIAEETMRRYQAAEKAATEAVGGLGLPPGGDIHYRVQGETHFWNPETIANLQIATRRNDKGTYREFSAAVRQNERQTLRGLMRFRKTAKPVPLEEVESAALIVRRFTTGAMSFGALGKEAHETLAIAMNRIGGKSNSGEGGEGAERFGRLPNGDSLSSAIKQVASGRFGVTAHYLVNAVELQIKMAQGAKPGEGGQLPGHKVDEVIARLRHSMPGVTLISPPPHHDIYSIEDLAQLIFDLKNANPRAAVSVKLVSEAGVGTVAAGVAKAYADKILVSGDSGGTGASPISSIKYAGIPWEIGIAETHQTLVMQGLRGRVRLETDGQLKTGRDVAVAALLGAEEFGFSTAPLIVEGCIMMRKCHLNTCPVGVATQDPVLRKKFNGQPEHVINYFFFVAEELREIMSQLGFRTVEEMVGRTDYLEFERPVDHWKAASMDLSRLLTMPECLIPGVPTERKCARRELRGEDHRLQSVLDHKILDACAPALASGIPVRLSLPVRNVDRSVGTMLSSEVARRYGAIGLPTGTIEIILQGTAGQSFGAFLSPGITLRLKGEANDYVGKGLCGGRIVVSVAPPEQRVPAVIAGNTCLYGATSGEVFIAGAVGERFAVRNSGATAVIEAAGDHACEYMTGGCVVVLGAVGRNFAAGMSGGHAYVLDEDGLFHAACNRAMIELEDLNAEDEEELLRLVQLHAQLTGSRKARGLLTEWRQTLSQFVKVMPAEYKRVLTQKQAAAAALEGVASNG